MPGAWVRHPPVTVRGGHGGERRARRRGPRRGTAAGRALRGQVSSPGSPADVRGPLPAPAGLYPRPRQAPGRSGRPRGQGGCARCRRPAPPAPSLPAGPRRGEAGGHKDAHGQDRRLGWGWGCSGGGREVGGARTGRLRAGGAGGGEGREQGISESAGGGLRDRWYRRPLLSPGHVPPPLYLWAQQAHSLLGKQRPQVCSECGGSRGFVARASVQRRGAEEPPGAPGGPRAALEGRSKP